MNIRRFFPLVSLGLMTGCPAPAEGDGGGESAESAGETDAGTTEPDTADGAGELPAKPTLQLDFSQVKQFDFSWAPTYAADFYQLLERAEGTGDYVQVGDDILGESVSLTMPLHFRANASYRLRACNATGCTDSDPRDVVGTLADAIGYFKASNTEAEDLFGWSVALSIDGNTLAIGAIGEDSNALGIGGDQANDAAAESGAVYVYRRDMSGGWAQEAYVKSSNTNADDGFGWRVALSAKGDTLAVGAVGEDSGATGIGGNPIDNTAMEAGAVYVFGFDTTQGWTQQAYVKASNTDANDSFGWALALSADGDTLAVGARFEASAALGVGGDDLDDSASGAGAVYVFARDAVHNWTQQAYVKASNTGPNDNFGYSVALASDGKTLAVGAIWEDSSATGIGGDQADDLNAQSGAVYVFTRSDVDQWTQHAYVKSSNAGPQDFFGWAVALSANGASLAVGARGEDSHATGIDGDQADETGTDSGAAYVFTRDDETNAWTQAAYVKASNTRVGDSFGSTVTLSAAGRTLAVGADWEDGNAVGVGGDPSNTTATDAGAAYVFQYDVAQGWRQGAYVKAPNTDAGDFFGDNLALSAEGETLVISSYLEDGNASNISGNQSDNSAVDAGAVYMY